MKFKAFVAALILMLASTAALAQANPANAPKPPAPDMPFGFHPPAALMSDWWNDPEVASELHLTDAQKKQLEQVSTNLKLTLIDAGATGLKSYVRLQAMLDADQVDRAAFNQQLDTASAAAANFVKDIGQMALTVRTTLSAEQWHKLEAMKAAGRMRHRMDMHGPMHPHTQPPSSLHNPPPQ